MENACCLDVKSATEKPRGLGMLDLDEETLSTGKAILKGQRFCNLVNLA
jgi:hypothetical protein